MCRCLPCGLDISCRDVSRLPGRGGGGGGGAGEGGGSRRGEGGLQEVGLVKFWLASSVRVRLIPLSQLSRAYTSVVRQFVCVRE